MPHIHRYILNTEIQHTRIWFEGQGSTAAKHRNSLLETQVDKDLRTARFLSLNKTTTIICTIPQ